MTSMFDYDDSVNLAYNAKTAGKSLVAAKHELFNKTGEFLFLAHSDREFAMRCQMVEKDIEKIAHHKLASLSDSKAKLVRAAFDEWQLRHANCDMCKTAAGPINVPVTPHDLAHFALDDYANTWQAGDAAHYHNVGRLVGALTHLMDKHVENAHHGLARSFNDHINNVINAYRTEKETGASRENLVRPLRSLIDSSHFALARDARNPNRDVNNLHNYPTNSQKPDNYPINYHYPTNYHDQ